MALGRRWAGTASARWRANSRSNLGCLSTEPAPINPNYKHAAGSDVRRRALGHCRHISPWMGPAKREMGAVPQEKLATTSRRFSSLIGLFFSHTFLLLPVRVSFGGRAEGRVGAYCGRGWGAGGRRLAWSGTPSSCKRAGTRQRAARPTVRPRRPARRWQASKRNNVAASAPKLLVPGRPVAKTASMVFFAPGPTSFRCMEMPYPVCHVINIWVLLSRQPENGTSVERGSSKNVTADSTSSLDVALASWSTQRSSFGRIRLASLSVEVSGQARLGLFGRLQEDDVCLASQIFNSLFLR